MPAGQPPGGRVPDADSPHAPAGDPLDVLVVPHTHWDREWYHPAGRFRQRLVALVDELLDAGARPERVNAPGARAPFLLDGQTVVLDDYLAVRPERRPALADALADGRVEAGPWYVLADELIPGGEALVRNLLAGRRGLAALGAAPPAVLYCPDSFGHPAALPTLAAGFGLRLTVLWRGYGGPRWPAGDAAWWRGADGSRVLLFHLPPDGYEFGSRLPTEPGAARERWAAMRNVLAPRARLGVLLVQNGADHHARQEGWQGAIDALAGAAAPERVRVVSLGAFADAALAGAARRERTGAPLPEVAGELRDSYGYTWTLQGTFGTRAAQKRRFAHAERYLVRDVEPWLALARLARDAAVASAVYEPADDATGADARRAALLDAAWRPVLRCLPHDTLCGCSIDAVARAMDGRLDDAAAQAGALRDDAVHALLGHDAAAARAARDAWRPVLVLRNRAPRARGGVAEVRLDAFVRDVAVGPGSAGGWRAATEASRTPSVAGAGVVVQPLERVRRHDRTESPRHYPDDDLVDTTYAVAWVPTVPAYGLASHALTEVPPRPDTSTLDGSAESLSAPAHPVRSDGTSLDNGIVTVTVDPRGRVRLAWPALGIAIDDWLGIEHASDAGDLYTPSLVGEARTAAWCAGVRVRHRGPLRGAIELVYRLRVPAALAPTPDGFSRSTRPVRTHVELPITVMLTLDADADFVRVVVRGENRARDHRLRVGFRTGLAGAATVADAAFGPVPRAPLTVDDADRRTETPPPTAPLHRWVARTTDSAGATLVSDGLAEYEASADGRIAVTLVRAVGELSRPDLPERPGHAGWPAATPGAQCPGPFQAAFGFAAHGAWSDATADYVERLADDVLLPLCGATLRSAVHVADAVGGVTLEGAGLAFGAARPADDPGWVALRCVNVTERAVEGAWRVAASVRDARLARLDETPSEALVVEALVVEAVDAAADHPRRRAVARIPFTAPARGVVTVLVRG